MEIDRKNLISKIDDKISDIASNKKEIVHTNFLDLYEQKVVNKYIIKKLKEYKNIKHVFYGGFSNPERIMLVIYKVHLEENEVTQYMHNEIKILRITKKKTQNVNEIKLDHRMYLGSLMKIGIKKECIGDIVTDSTGADIILNKEISKFVLNELIHLKRYSNVNMDFINISDIKKKIQEYNKLDIIIASMRIDVIVSEILHISRNKAKEIVLSERIFVNFEECKNVSKAINEYDIISIRGKGRYKLDGVVRKTKNNNLVLQILEYIG